MTTNVQDIISNITGTLPIHELPVTVIETIEKHKASMMSLAAALLAGGNDELYIKTVLETSFASFRSELSNTIVALKESGQLS